MIFIFQHPRNFKRFVPVKLENISANSDLKVKFDFPLKSIDVLLMSIDFLLEFIDFLSSISFKNYGLSIKINSFSFEIN